MRQATRPSTTVLLGLSHPLVATTLAQALEKPSRTLIVSDSFGSLQDGLESSQPAVALVDIVVGSDPIFPYLHQLVAHFARTRFVVLTASSDRALVERAFLAGALGVLDHTCHFTDVVTVVDTVSEGSPWPLGIGIASAAGRRSPAPLFPLSPVLQQVHELLWLGHTHRQIAVRLDRSIKTVDASVSKIRIAYGVARGAPGPWEHRQRGRQPRPGT